MAFSGFLGGEQEDRSFLFSVKEQCTRHSLSLSLFFLGGGGGGERWFSSGQFPPPPPSSSLGAETSSRAEPSNRAPDLKVIADFEAFASICFETFGRRWRWMGWDGWAGWVSFVVWGCGWMGWLGMGDLCGVGWDGSSFLGWVGWAIFVDSFCV